MPASRKKYTHFWLLILTLALGCRDDGRTASADDFPALRELTNVQLGITAAQLAQARPDVQVAPYYGYHELVGQWLIKYEVPGGLSEGQAPPQRAQVTSIVAVDTLLTSDFAERFAAEFTRLSLHDPKCVAVAGPVNRILFAVSDLPVGSAYLRVDSPHSFPGAAIPGLVTFGISKSSPLDVPAGDQSEVPCPKPS